MYRIRNQAVTFGLWLVVLSGYAYLWLSDSNYLALTPNPNSNPNHNPNPNTNPNPKPEPKP